MDHSNRGVLNNSLLGLFCFWLMDSLVLEYSMCYSSSSLRTFLHLQPGFLDVTASFPLLYCISNFYHHFTVWSTEFGSLLDRKSHKSTSFEQETTIGLFTNCIFINIWHFISILKHFCINFLSEIENSESSTKHCFWWWPFCL